MPTIKDTVYFSKAQSNSFVSPFSDFSPANLYSSITLPATRTVGCLTCAMVGVTRADVVESLKAIAQDTPGISLQERTPKDPEFSLTIPIIPEQPIPVIKSIRFKIDRLFVEFRGCMPYVGIVSVVKDYPITPDQETLNGAGTYANFQWTFTYDIASDTITNFLGYFTSAGGGVIYFAQSPGPLGFPKPSPVIFPEIGTLYYDEASAYDLNTGAPGDHGCNTYLYISGAISLEMIYAT